MDNRKEMRVIHSPCVSICAMDEYDQYCIGCMRTSEEIANWINMSEEEQLAKMEELKTREFED